MQQIEHFSVLNSTDIVVLVQRNGKFEDDREKKSKKTNHDCVAIDI